MKYLPSNKFLAVISIGAAIFLGAWLYAVYQKSSVVFNRPAAVPTADWQSTLSAHTAQGDADNLTQSATQGLVTEYLSAVKDNSGNDLSKTDQTQVAQTVAAQVASQSTSSPAYVKGDLKLIADSADAYRAYGNALGTLFAQYAKEYPQNETDAMHAGIENKDRTELAKLSLAAVVYQKLAADIVALPVPLSIADTEVDLVNGYAGLGKALIDVQSVLDDSMRGFIGITEYEYRANQVVGAFQGLRTFFADQHMVFSASDPGSLFTATH